MKGWKKTTSRFLAMLLVVVMLFGMIPTTAFAAGDTSAEEKTTEVQTGETTGEDVPQVMAETGTDGPYIKTQPTDLDIVLPWPKSTQSLFVMGDKPTELQGKWTYQWYKNSVKEYEGAEKLDNAIYNSLEFEDKTTKTGDLGYYYCKLTFTPTDGSEATELTSDIARVSIKAPEEETYGVIVGEDPIGKVYVSVVDEVAKRDDLRDGMGNLIEDIGPMKKAPVTMYEEVIYPSDNMMTVIARAILVNGGSQKGAANGYIESVTNANGETRAEFSRGNGSGWMGTLNGWKTNMGFQNYSVKNGELQSGDIIKVMYTTDLGNDIGLGDTVSEQALAKLQVYSYFDRWATGAEKTSGGFRILDKFDSSRYDYTAVANSSKLWVYTAAKSANTRIRVYSDGKEYSGSNTIPVENGMKIQVVLTNPSDSSAKKIEYTILVIKSQTILHSKGADALSVEYLTKDNTSLGQDETLTYVKHSSYYQFKTTAPSYTVDTAKNATGFTVTLKELPEGVTAQLEDPAGKLYDFADGKVTVQDAIEADGTYNYYIKLKNGDLRESYLLAVKKAATDFGMQDGNFIGSSRDYNKDYIYNGQPEGTYFQLDAEGKETGKTGFHASVHDYNIYVSSTLASIKADTAGFGFVGGSASTRLNFILTMDGQEEPLVKYTSAWATNLKPWLTQGVNKLNDNQGILLTGEKTSLHLQITNAKDETQTAEYHFHFIRVKMTPEELEKMIEDLPTVNTVNYAEDRLEIENVENLLESMDEADQEKISKEAKAKLTALRTELDAQKTTGEKLIKELAESIGKYKDAIPSDTKELTKELYDQYGEEIKKSGELYQTLAGWALEQFQSNYKEEQKVYANAAKLMNAYRIHVISTTGIATDYIDDFMVSTLYYNLDLGQAEDAYKITFRDIIYSDADNRPEERRNEAGLPYNIPGRLKITVADESILEIKTVLGEYVDQGLGGGDTPFADELYYMIPKKSGTTTITATLTDETGIYYGQIPEITVHVNSTEETAIGNLSTKLTDISSRAYTRSNDTWYYWQGQEGAPFTFKVNGTNAKVTVKEYLGEKKTEYTPDQDGNVTVLLKDGYNSIEVTATYEGKTVTQAYGMKGKVLSYTVSNKSRPGCELRAGDTASIQFTGLNIPVHKILRIYNPIFPITTYYTQDLPQQSVVRAGGMLGTSEHTAAAMEIKLTASGKITFTGGCQTSSWYGSATGSEGDQGNTGGIADQLPGTFSVLPDFTLDVAENPDYKTEAIYTTEVVGGTTVKAGQKVTIKIPDLPTDELEKTYPAVTYSYDANKFIQAQTTFATTLPKVTVQSDLITNPNNGQAVSLSGLKTITFTIPSNTPAGEYKIYGGSVSLKQGDYVYTISKTVPLFECQIADVVLTVEESDINKIYESTGKWLTENVTNPTVSSMAGEWAVLGLARAGYEVPAGYYDKYLENAAKTLKEKNGVLSESKYTEYSRMILALTAIGADVTDIGGYNLLEKLSDYDNICIQGINGPIWALIALDSHGYEIPAVAEGGTQATRENLIQTILDKQLENGGWTLTGTNADVDMTAMAIQALAPYCDSNAAVKAAVEKAVELLASMQNDDASFSSYGAKNAESTAQVIVALTALGIDPAEDERFIRDNVTMIDALCGFYVEGGGFEHTAGQGRNAMATEQGYYALASYMRLLKRQTSLYDMSDVTIGGDHFEELPGGDGTNTPGGNTDNGTGKPGSTDGNSTGTNVPGGNSKTGDHTQLIFWSVLAAIAFGTAGVMLIARRKKEGQA